MVGRPGNKAITIIINKYIVKLNAVVEGSLSHHSAESYASVTRSSPQIVQARTSSLLSGNSMPTYASRSHKLILFGLQFPHGTKE